MFSGEVTGEGRKVGLGVSCVLDSTLWRTYQTLPKSLFLPRPPFPYLEDDECEGDDLKSFLAPERLDYLAVLG